MFKIVHLGEVVSGTQQLSVGPIVNIINYELSTLLPVVNLFWVLLTSSLVSDFFITATMLRVCAWTCKILVSHKNFHSNEPSYSYSGFICKYDIGTLECHKFIHRWEQAVACALVTQGARFRSPVGTSFLGEVFSGFFLTFKMNVRKL